MSDDCSAWTPCHGGGAVLTVGGVVVVEIEPMGQGWWVSVGGVAERFARCAGGNIVAVTDALEPAGNPPLKRAQ